MRVNLGTPKQVMMETDTFMLYGKTSETGSMLLASILDLYYFQILIQTGRMGGGPLTINKNTTIISAGGSVIIGK